MSPTSKTSRRSRSGDALRPSVRFVIGAAIVGILVGLGLAWLAAEVIRPPWNTLLITSALWGIVVHLILIATGRAAHGRDSDGAFTWLLAGSVAMLGLLAGAEVLYPLLTDGGSMPKLPPITLLAAFGAGALVGSVSHDHIARGHGAIIGVVGGLALGEAAYGLAAIDLRAWHFWAEAGIGLVFALVAAGKGVETRRRSLLYAALTAVAILGACYAYDAWR